LVNEKLSDVTQNDIRQFKAQHVKRYRRRTKSSTKKDKGENGGTQLWRSTTKKKSKSEKEGEGGEPSKEDKVLGVVGATRKKFKRGD